MESLRDVKRVMEREIKKGSCPLRFERLEFVGKPFQYIWSEEKLNEVLSYLLRVGEFGRYKEKTITNNVYMDLDVFCRKPQFRRTHSVMERNEIYHKIQRRKERLQPDFEGGVCLETVKCVFSLSEEEAKQFKMTYNGQEAYGFIMSNKYILGLFTYCEAARKSLALNEENFLHLSEEEQCIARLGNVKNVLFQALLLDNVSMENGLVYAEMCTVMILE